MTTARVAAFTAALLLAFPMVAVAQGTAPVAAQAAPKKGGSPAARPSAPSPVPLDNTGKPIPVRPPQESAAYDGSQAAIVQKLSAYLTSLQTVIGDFVQLAPDGTRSVGKFYIQKPGRVRFEYEPPTPLDVIADGNQVAVRDRSLQTEDVYPLSQTPLRYLLAEQIDLARDTNLVGIAQDSSFITLTIDEQHLLVGNYRLVLMFTTKDLQLRQWTITDPQGYETTVAIYNLDPVHKPDPGKFIINYEPSQQ